MTQEYLDQLIDKNGNPTNPYTLTQAIKDATDKLVMTSGNQMAIGGTKNFIDQLTVNGRNVLLTGDAFKDAVAVPNNDIQAINESGLYHYHSTENNLPHMDNEYANGFIVSVFTDDGDYGILLFIGSLTYIEKYQGQWRTPHSVMPVKLWEGAAKLGDTVNLKSSVNEFDDLQFFVNTVLGQTRLRTSAINGKTRYVTQVGQTRDGKNTRSLELTIDQSDDGNSMTISQVLFNPSPGNSTQVTDAVLDRIEGIRG
ncbi:hypothetical protein LpLQ80_02975 [Lactiplantibacillus plantarum]|uniref:hypothetical protein n=1 Tax=Lactiplantibacillus plantarum TaxID=1590 RepID=UPI000D58C7F0|nr:hypothetical protein [Lactiplantibacillus plantarum]AWI39524.1 hypothetical protein LpLQ80_02975 [Lactiplantibacillus plantarum]